MSFTVGIRRSDGREVWLETSIWLFRHMFPKRRFQEEDPSTIDHFCFESDVIREEAPSAFDQGVVLVDFKDKHVFSRTPLLVPGVLCIDTKQYVLSDTVEWEWITSITHPTKGLLDKGQWSLQYPALQVQWQGPLIVNHSHYVSAPGIRRYATLRGWRLRTCHQPTQGKEIPSLLRTLMEEE